VDLEDWSFKTIRDADANVQVKAKNGDQTLHFSQEQIRLTILKKLKRNAEAFFNEKVTDAVISVPTDFDEESRDAIKLACRRLGFNVLEVVDKATAATLCYGFRAENTPAVQTVLVINLADQNTFDLSIIRIGNGDTFDVLGACGNLYESTGEDYFTNILVDFLSEKLDKINLDLRSLGRQSWARDWLKCRGLVEGLELGTIMRRGTFERVCQVIFNNIIRAFQQALEEKEMVDQTQIDEVLIIIKDSNRIPKIEQMLSKYFTMENTKCTIIQAEYPWT
jgi:molecular chaperone DnaK (HSP70)